MKKFVLFLLVLLLSGPTFAQLGQSLYGIVGDDGKPVANHAVPAQFSNAIERLPGKVVVGNPKGDVTIAEFYDLNCPFCRRASQDIADIIRNDKQLRVVLVPFPVLGIASIQAGRVELAVQQSVDAQRFYEFHQKIYSGRGVIDGQRAVDVAQGMKLDMKKLVALADEDSIADIMKSHVQLGNALGLAATPAFVINGVAILGHPGRKSLAGIITSVRACGKVVC
jgi:protein-disulfide isomerase